MKKHIAFMLASSLFFAAVLPAVPASAAGTANPAPNVIPAVTEWTGGEGTFTVKDGARIVLSEGAELSEAKKDIIRGYFDDMLFISVDFAAGEARTGDIILAHSSDTSLGGEGYTMDATETNVIISGTTEISLLYGIITLIQSCYHDGYMPCGHVRDVPQYGLRSGMIDVARTWIPLDYVEEITKYFAWFKLNEIHLHINDNSSDGNGYFRLESDVPGLTAEDHYSKKDYREYQLRMREYGVSVVTEIDTPAHSKCFKKAVPELMLDDSHLDISKPETLKFVCDLWDEYVAGEEPVFIGDTVHFGTDEYPDGHNEEMRAYTDALMKHLRSRGYTTRFWGSFGGKGFNGSTPVSGDSQCNYWAVELSDHKVLWDMGYDIINTCGPILYCVPGGNGFADYFDLNNLYSKWFVNILGIYNGKKVAENDKQLLGACFALWNDIVRPATGFSMFEIFDRLRYQVCLVAEKTWTGSRTAKISAENFISRFEKLSVRGGNADPARRKYAIDADVTKALEEGEAISYGWPYYMSADVTVTKKGAVITEGKDGKLFVNAAGKLSFERGGVTYIFDRGVTLGEKTNIRLYGDRTSTVLIVDGKWVSEPVLASGGKAAEYSSSFVLPLEKIGGENCVVENLTLAPEGGSLNDLLYESNVALGKKVTVSGLEVNDGRLNEPMAVDGDMNTRLSFDRSKDTQWMVVDLADVYDISKIIIHYFESVQAFELYVSEDGENFEKVFEASGKEEGRRVTETVEFKPVRARYVKYVQLKRWYASQYNTYYSGGISEFEVYKVAFDYTPVLEAAEQCGDTEINLKIRAIKRYLAGERVFAIHLKALCDELEAMVYAYNHPGEESSEEITAEESLPESAPEESAEVSAPEEGGGKTGLIIGIAAAAAAICAAACALIFKKKKKK